MGRYGVSSPDPTLTEDPIGSPIGVLASLRRGWVTIALLGLLGLVVGAAVSFVLPSRYEASSDVFFSVRAGDSLNELSQGNTFVESRIRSYASIVTSPLVLQPVIDQLGLDTTVAGLAKQVEADPQLDTVILRITATSGDPAEAAAIANDTVRSLSSAVAQVEEAGRDDLEGAPTVQLTVTSEAVAPTQPASPNKLVFAALGALVGLAGGAVVAILRGRVDDTIRRVSDVTDVLPRTPLLGRLPRAATGEAMTDAVAQARTLLLSAVADREHPTVLVSSAERGEGRTIFATELALSLAGMGRRVCLVDADLRSPGVAGRLGLEPSPGLRDILTGGANLASAVRTVEPSGLSVIPAGGAVASSADLLASTEMDRLLRRLEVHWDVVIVDAAPLGDGADASILAETVGAVVLVTRAGGSTRRALAHSAERVASLRSRLVGIVFDAAPVRGRRARA